MEDIVVEAVQNSTTEMSTEDKGIQVSPSIISKCRRTTLCDMIKTNRNLNAGISTIHLLDKICKAASMLERKYTKPLLPTFFETTYHFSIC